MKNLFFAAFLLLLGQTAQAQFFSVGLKGGVNTQVHKPNDIVIGSGDSSLNLGVDKFKFGTQFGAYVRVGGLIFFQPEVLFNSHKTDYRVKNVSLSNIRSETYRDLDFPLLVGIKLGPVRALTGPVGHYFLNSTSELSDIKGYKENFKKMTWGWQTGINVGFGRFSVDARYEGNFHKQGDQISFFGHDYHFSNSPARFILGVNFAIIK
ncbi:MAG: outer membrane beta-barrel protein [Saprospiraceae bacterium]